MREILFRCFAFLLMPVALQAWPACFFSAHSKAIVYSNDKPVLIKSNKWGNYPGFEGHMFSIPDNCEKIAKARDEFLNLYNTLYKGTENGIASSEGRTDNADLIVNAGYKQELTEYNGVKYFRDWTEEDLIKMHDNPDPNYAQYYTGLDDIYQFACLGTPEEQACAKEALEECGPFRPGTRQYIGFAEHAKIFQAAKFDLQIRDADKLLTQAMSKLHEHKLNDGSNLISDAEYQQSQNLHNVFNSEKFNDPDRLNALQKAVDCDKQIFQNHNLNPSSQLITTYNRIADAALAGMKYRATLKFD